MGIELEEATKRGPLHRRILCYSIPWALIAIMTAVSLAPLSMPGVTELWVAAVACTVIFYLLALLVERLAQPFFDRILPPC
jgi:hypothetical protein